MDPSWTRHGTRPGPSPCPGLGLDPGLGLRTLESGLWILESGPWSLDPGIWTLEPGSGPGAWIWFWTRILDLDVLLF